MDGGASFARLATCVDRKPGNHHMSEMDIDGKEQIESTSCGLSRDDMLRAIGVDPGVIKWPGLNRASDSDLAAVRCELEPLSDLEWTMIAPQLPAEAARGNVMRNRAFVDAVLVAVARGSWSDHRKRGANSDAVRRRFGRWAHQGAWQRLAAITVDLPLSEARKASFAAIARRAATLAR
jgi:hypothetical protein